MADVLDLLSDALSPRAVKALARPLGLDEGTTAKLVAAVVPVLVERLGSNARAGDAENIATAAAKDHDGSLLESAADFLGGRFTSGPGQGILGHVFGDQLAEVSGRISSSTGVPEPVVGLAFKALAPLVMAALTKAALGALTAVVVVKLLDVAGDQIRSGKVQRWFGSVNARLDTDGDGNAADDVGRRGLSTVKAAAGKLVGLGRRAAKNPKVRDGAAAGKKAAASLGKKARGLFKKWRG